MSISCYKLGQHEPVYDQIFIYWEIIELRMNR